MGLWLKGVNRQFWVETAAAKDGAEAQSKNSHRNHCIPHVTSGGRRSQRDTGLQCIH